MPMWQETMNKRIDQRKTTIVTLQVIMIKSNQIAMNPKSKNQGPQVADENHLSYV